MQKTAQPRMSSPRLREAVLRGVSLNLRRIQMFRYLVISTDIHLSTCCIALLSVCITPTLLV